MKYFKKEKILTLFFVSILFVAKAQTYVGIQTGFNENHLSADITSRSYTINKSRLGLNLSILVESSLTEQLSLEYGLSYFQKNYSFERAGQFAGVYDMHANEYLQFPLDFKYEFGSKFRFFINAGLFSGYWLSGSVKGKVPDIYSASSNNVTGQTYSLEYYNERYHFSNERDNRLEYGYIAGIGVLRNLNKKYKLQLGFNYCQALSDQQKKYMVNQIPQFNHSLALSIGIKKGLK